MLAARLEIRRFAREGEVRFRADARYKLENVTRGFAPRFRISADDTELLERICEAYCASIQDQEHAPEAYQATTWWSQVRRTSLAEIIHALRTRDIYALRTMYRTFFRDPCSTGLIHVPYGMTRAYFSGSIRETHARYYLSDTLCHVDTWAEHTDGAFAIDQLAAPEVGNPFGVFIEDTLVGNRAGYHHYCAHRVRGQLGSDGAVVAEIGGGYGAMAYYLLRSRKNLTYLNFDVPESIALASYYLVKALPDLKFVFYQEREIDAGALNQADGQANVILMPSFQLAKMPVRSVDVAFSSHAMSDLSVSAVDRYLGDITQMTRAHFMHVSHDGGPNLVAASAARSGLPLTESRRSSWEHHRRPRPFETEHVYRVANQ
jgi:putative sugar O-methyltransferase